MFNKVKVILFFGLLAAWLLSGCPTPLDPVDPPSLGAVSLNFSMSDGKTIVPDFDMNAVQYVIDGHGPGGNSVSITTTGINAEITELVPGDWTFVVYAKNKDEAVIGQGSTVVRVVVAQTAQASITIKPIEGIGKLNVTVTWDTVAVNDPVLSIELLPATGPLLTADFAISVEGVVSKAETVFEELPNGYYQMGLMLYDGETRIIGLKEIVRIIAGQVTTATIPFEGLLPVTGGIVVNIDVQLSNPIDVVIGPSEVKVNPGKTVALNASVFEESLNVSYIWYVNGDQAGIDSTFNFSAQSVGIYRVDVLAFSFDGARAGSASRVINVTDEPLGDADWTIMIYLDGDNNLEEAAMIDLNEMEAVDLSGKKVNIIALVDRIPGYYSGEGNWTGTRLYKIEYDPNGFDTTFRSTRIEGMGLSASTDSELNMGDPATLSSFVDFCTVQYSAAHYALVLWNHGDGWRSAPQSSGIVKAVCADDSNNHDILFSKEIKETLIDKELTVLGFDACLMGMVEVAFEMKDCADIMIASEELEPGDGWDYVGFLSKLKASDMSPDAFAVSVVDSFGDFYAQYGPTTLSALRLDKLGSLVAAINIYADNLSTCDLNQVREARNSTQSYGFPEFADLYHFTELFPVTGFEAVQAAIIEAVIANRTNYITGNGLAIYFPMNPGAYYYSDYNSSVIDFPGVSTWDNFLSLFVALPEETDEYEPDDSYEVATELPLGVIQDHTLHSLDKDYFVFAGREGMEYTIETFSSVDDLDTTVTLFDRDGVTTLAFNDDKNISRILENRIDKAKSVRSLQSRIHWICLVDGLYFVKVSGFGNASGSYSISVTEAVPVSIEPIEWSGITWHPDRGERWSVIDNDMVMTGNDQGNISFIDTDSVYTDFVFEVDLFKSNSPMDSPLGCLFGKTDDLNYYLFMVGFSETYAIAKFVNGVAEVLVDWTPSTAIKPIVAGGVNTLKVSVSGTDFQFFINDILLESLSDLQYTAGHIALAAYDLMDDVAHFQNPVITIP